MIRGRNMEELLQKAEALFIKYGAVPTPLNVENRMRFGERVIYERDGCYIRAGAALFDGQPFLILSSIDRQKFAELGLLEDVDALPLDCPEERLEKAVRYALGVEAYPEVYP